jgi:cytochrome c biogenesis protein CcmG, thiol:disulfide interchange protein DsbE
MDNSFSLRRAFALALAGALAACGHAASSNAKSDVSDQNAVAHAGQPAPNFTEPSLPGPTLSLASLRGKAVYLNFFATWCPPCNDEAPQIEALQKRFASAGLAVVGVDVLENAKKAAQFQGRHHLSYPVVVDDGTLRNQYNVNGLPVHVFIDRKGVVQKIIVGELQPADMESNVRAILR